MLFILIGLALLCVSICGINDYSDGKCFVMFLKIEDEEE